MDGTDKGSTATSDTGASAVLRTPADELHDAEAVSAAVYRLHALGRAVQVMADPDLRSMPTERVDWDGTMRAIEALAAMIAEQAEDIMEPAGELLHATLGRAEGLAKETPEASVKRGVTPPRAGALAACSPDRVAEIEAAAIRLGEAVSAVRAIVAPVWNNPIEADRARDALQWIADKADDEASVLMDAIDEARR